MPDGHEQEIDADRARAFKIGAHRIADRQHAARRDLAPGRGLRLGQRHVVDRPVGLAGVEHLAAHGGVEIGDRAGAIDQLRPALHHHVGIAADHEQLAREHGFEPGAVVVRRLHVVVVEAGADHVVGALQRREAHIEPGEDRAVALGPEMEQALPGARRDHAAGDVAGGDDGVIGLARHMQLVELARHHLALARRIGDQDHGRAAGARAHQRVAGVRESGEAVMHHAPDVAQQHVVIGGQRREMRDQGRQGGARHLRWSGGRSRPGMTGMYRIGRIAISRRRPRPVRPADRRRFAGPRPAPAAAARTGSPDRSARRSRADRPPCSRFRCARR